MRRQREKERLANEAYIRKLQEEEEQKRMLQLAQDQLLAKTLAKQEIENAKERRERPTRMKLNNQTKPKVSARASAKTKISADKKQNVALISKIRSERYASTNAKHGSTSAQKELSETVATQKPVPIHNAVTRVVTHQSRSSQPNKSTCSAAPDELIGSSSKIYGQQSEEELHVPSDVLSNKKKKLGVEVCMTVNVEDEERIGSAESAGSHDSMNQEFHHFKPIKALPRTPFRTIDGKQVEPKLIKILPILKRVSNVVPKAPMPTLTKKVFGCAWSAFKRIAKQQVLLKDSLSQYQQQQLQETKKTEQRKTEQTSRSLQKSELDERSNTDSSSAVSFDSNKNYTKNSSNKVVNGTKLNKNEQPADNVKQTSKRGKMRNGLIASAFKKKEIEVVQIDDDDDEDEEHINVDGVDGPDRERTPDPLGPSPDKLDPESRPSSPVLAFAAVENIAERIKRRKATNTGTANTQSAVDSVKPVEQAKAKGKKQSTRGRKPKAKKQQEATAAATAAPTKPAKTKPKKTTVETTVTSQIKRLARAKASKRPRYAEDSEESEEEQPTVAKQKSPEVVAAASPPRNSIEPKQTEPTTAPASEQSNVNKLSSPSPRKRPRKNAHPSKKQKPTVVAASPEPSINLESETLLKEQERLERLAEQERKDRELAEELQARFNAMERVAGRTRRGVARLPAAVSPPLVEQPKRLPQKQQQRPAVK